MDMDKDFAINQLFDRVSKLEERDKREATAEQQQCGQMAYRASSRSVLEDRISRLRQQADDLLALSNAMPLQLPPQADEALGNLLNNLRPPY